MKKLLVLFALLSTPAFAQTGAVQSSNVIVPSALSNDTSPAGTDQLFIYQTGATSPLNISLSQISTFVGASSTPWGTSGQVQYNNSGAFGGLTNTQLTADINAFTSSLSGAVPSSGGGSTNFLRADGTWAAPSGGGSYVATAPTQQIFTTGSGTYTTPAGVLWVKIRMVGGGGGGGGSGTSAGGSTGGSGGNTTFGTSLLAANGGSGGSNSAGYGSPTSGGTASGGNINITGASGGASSNNTAFIVGTYGGSTPFGGGGSGGTPNNGGGSAQSNTGAGGGGAGGVSSSVIAGGGGTPGGYLEKIITSPSSTYSYAVGAAGSGGSSGTSGFTGGAGGSGLLIVEEHYND